MTGYIITAAAAAAAAAAAVWGAKLDIVRVAAGQQLVSSWSYSMAEISRDIARSNIESRMLQLKQP